MESSLQFLSPRSSTTKRILTFAFVHIVMPYANDFHLELNFALCIEVRFWDIGPSPNAGVPRLVRYMFPGRHLQHKVLQ